MRDPRTVGGSSETRVIHDTEIDTSALVCTVGTGADCPRLVYGSPLARCSGFQNTSRAQRGDDAVTYVTDFHCAHTMRAHSRRAKEKTRLSIRTGALATGVWAHSHWGPPPVYTRTILASVSCTTATSNDAPFHINTVCVRRGPTICWSDGSGRCAILYSRGLASKPASPRQC